MTSSAPPTRELENLTRTHRPCAPFGVTSRNVFPPSVVRSSWSPVPVASTASATPVGATVAAVVRVAGTTTGVHVVPPSVVCRSAGTDPVQIAHSVVAETATTLAPETGHGAPRLTKWPSRSEDAQRRAPPVEDDAGTPAIQTDVPDALMLAVVAIDVNGKRSDFQWPVATPARWSQRSTQPVLSQRPVKAKTERSVTANATTPCTPLGRHFAPPFRVTQSGARPPDGDVAASGSKAKPSDGSANRTVSITAFFVAGGLVDDVEGAPDVVAGGLVVEVGADVDDVDGVLPDVAAVPVADAAFADVAVAGVDVPVGPGCVALVVTVAAGADRATNSWPPSMLRTTAAQRRCPHGTEPRSQNSVGEVSV